ncbi:putative disease resistance protein RGA4 [Cornus florida]|uniref:putative disease resistance protein RGA4 n=1 Tax=Cornus florida TaxID=4283 RepID=UPI0028973E77|nr:putative disease resistance protein RGA4 [Cornus florida]
MAFEQMEEYRHTSKVEIGKEIVEKCKGVPLAIRAIGSLLYSKDTIDEWLFFKNNDLLKIAESENIILPVLKLGYDHLPSSLKRCFAFCSLYWKDDEIYKNELIQMWIAHGFIRSVYEDQQLEDASDLYFMDLLKRSFFHDVKTDEVGEIIRCKMHDLLHDVAQSVARHEISTLNNAESNSNAESVTKRTRHVSFRYRVDSSLETPIRLRANNLLTLILKNQDRRETSFENIVSTFKSLHVLDLSHLGIKTVPNNIGELIHLRYIDLSDTLVETLPNSVTKLQNLCTLKLNSCHGLEELPREIKKLACLRHLELDQCYALTGMPGGLGQLMFLFTLTRFVADSCSRLSELQNLNNLHGKLRIVLGRRDSCNQCLEDATAEGMKGSNFLEAKQYLKTLALCFSKNDHDDDELLLESLRPHPNLKELIIYFYRGVSFPSWLMAGLCLPNLVRIDMESCDRCIHLPLFEHLPSLQFLRIRWMRSLEYLDSSSGSGSGGEESLSSSLPSSSSSSSGGGGGAATAARRRSEPTPTFFPFLKELSLLQLHNLKGLWRSEAVEEEATTGTIASLPDQQPPPQHLKKTMPYCLPSFPYPSKLTVRDCPNLKSMPILPPYLEELHLRYVSEELVKRLFMMTESPTPTISTTTDTVSTMSSSSSSSLLLHLFNLKSLSLDSFVSLPAGLQHLTNLQTLKIEWCDNLMALPEWTGNLASLERLEFHHCPKLTTLPDGMRQLTALQQLTITSPSNVLYDRCQKETEEDWPKIAHIPKVDIELWQ